MVMEVYLTLMSSPPPISSPTLPNSPLGGWKAYFGALTRADQEWAVKYGGKFGIVTGKNSHLQTIRAAQPIFKHDWRSLLVTEARILLGLIDSDGADYGHLGSLKAAGAAKNVFLDATPQNLKTQSSIQEAINSMRVAPFGCFLSANGSSCP